LSECPFCHLKRRKLDDFNWREHIIMEVQTRKPKRIAEVLLRLLSNLQSLGIPASAELNPLDIPLDMLVKFPNGIEHKNGRWQPVRKK